MYIQCLSDKTRARTKIETVSERKTCEIAHVNPPNWTMYCNPCGTNPVLSNANMQCNNFSANVRNIRKQCKSLTFYLSILMYAVKVTFEDLQQQNHHQKPPSCSVN